MKTATFWMGEAEPAMPLAPALDEPLVRRIQADALLHAAEMVRKYDSKADWMLETLAQELTTP